MSQVKHSCSQAFPFTSIPLRAAALEAEGMSTLQLCCCEIKCTCSLSAVAGGTDVTEAEFHALNVIREQSDLSSEWWGMQCTLLRDCVLFRSAEQNFRSLGITPAVRMQRDVKCTRLLEMMYKTALALKSNLTRSLDLQTRVGNDRTQELMNKCALNDVAVTVLGDLRLLESALTTLLQAEMTAIRDILAQLESHTMGLHMPKTTWKTFSDPMDGDEVMTKASASIATLKGSLITSDHKSLKEAWQLEWGGGGGGGDFVLLMRAACLQSFNNWSLRRLF